MTNLALNQQDAEQRRRCISALLIHMITDYQQTQPERRELATVLPPSEEGFSAFEALELSTSDLYSYVNQMQVRVWIENEPVAIAHLRTLRLSIAVSAQFYFGIGQHYPKAKEGARRLNDLRLLLLAYLQAYIQPEAA